MKIPFFVLEGGEGAGKTTQIKRLKEYFGDRIVITREPGGSPTAEAIRTYIFAHPELTALEQFEKFWEARESHLKETIRPALEAGKIVVSDRFDSSTFAYQIRAKETPELVDAFWQYRKSILGDTVPSLYIYLDIDSKVGLARKAKQKDGEVTHFDQWELPLHERMREGFSEFFTHVPHQIIDAARSEDEVFVDLVDILETHVA